MEAITYNGYEIKQNECGWFNAPGVNCFSAQSLESAKRAIDAYIARRNAARADREFAKAFTPNKYGEYA
jgi:hypothetical protein